MMKVFALLFVVLASCSALHVPSQFYVNTLLREVKQEGQPRVSANINKYVDEVLENLKLKIVTAGLDPLPVKDIVEAFSAKIGLITWHGELTLTEGWLQGLSTIRRSGDSVMNYEKQFLNLVLNIEFDSLDLNYDYRAQIMDLGPTGGLQGKIKDMNVLVDITIDTKSMEVILQNFEITNSGTITVHFSGHPIVDWLTNILSGLATRLLHGVAQDVVENRVRGIIEKTINDINNALHPNGYLY